MAADICVNAEADVASRANFKWDLPFCQVLYEGWILDSAHPVAKSFRA